MFTLPNYKILELLHQGKSHNIFRAISLIHHQSVIIKTPIDEVPNTQQCAVLMREFEIGKSLDHPNIVKYYALEKYEHRLALVMEDFGGEKLAQLIPQNGFQLLDFLNIALQLVKAVRAIHQQNIIHQAISPNSIFVHPDHYTVKLDNFKSVSRLIYETQTPIAADSVSIAKLAYISPEQTGRMNRSINMCTDFYSLGVVFYQMLYGHLPFITNDALELVHCHLAKRPLFPQKEKPEIPPIIFKIVEKLLAKNAEDRYQSAYGLEMDLQESLSQLKTTGTIQNFEISKYDAVDKFCIHQKLYGRQAEINQLLETFNEISEGKTDNAILLVHGYSGVGKTSLINEIQKPLVQARGNFISGKCEQFECNMPYMAFTHAFRQLIGQILTESEEKITEWKTKLLAAMGSNGQIMIDVIPELEIIIGSQPAVIELAPIENQYRFQNIFRNFVAVFSQPSHPLVMFIDDLQWASTVGLNLAKFILLHPDTRYFYLIGAYRDNEVDTNHPLHKTLDEIQKQKPIRDIALKPLAFYHINQLIADTLHVSADKTKKLATVVYAKTQGNPFFTNQFLTTLCKNKLINFDAIKKQWAWDIKQIKKSNITDNVVDLMIGKIRQLPKETQTALSLAANIGYEFSLDILAIIREASLDDTANALWPAVQEGFILSLGKNYYEAAEHSRQFHFLHDRVQQAAALLIPVAQRQPLQLKIGRLLLEKTPPTALEKKLFYIVGQLNAGRELITDPNEKIKLAGLNLNLAKKSKDSTAYAFAMNHAQIGIDLLPQQRWQTHYDLTLALYKQLAENSYLAGNFDAAEKLYPLILKATHSDLDKISVYCIQTNQLELQGRYADAVRIMRTGLALFNIQFPDDETQLQALLSEELKQIRINLKERKIKELIESPEMTDPQAIATMNLLLGLWTPCFVVGLQTLLMVANVKMANLSLRYGNCESTAAAYAGYSYYAGALTSDYTEAYQFGKMGIKLSHHYNNLFLRCISNFLFANGTCIWKKPLATSCLYLEYSYDLGVESGNLTYASYASHFIIFYRFMQGIELATVSKLLQNYLSFLQRTNPAMFDYAMALTQPIRDLMGIPEHFDEARHLATYPQKSVFGSAYYLGKIITAYLLGDVKSSLVYVDNALAIVPIFLQGTFKAVEAEFYIALTYLAAYSTVDFAEQQQYLNKVETIQSHMNIWMNSCEANYSHKYFLIEAEKARVLGKQSDDVLELYEQAIVAARKYEFIQHEALANELCAKYWLSKHKEKIATLYLQEAYHLYNRWGATAKVQQLKNTYPSLLINLTTADLSSVALQPFDLKTAMKAAQAISSEINLDKLLSKMMQVIMENAGAQKGAFILNKEGNFTIEAECCIQNEQISTLQAIPLEDWERGCRTVVQYVTRTKQLLILGAANTDSQFGSDPYITKAQTKSILCIPIMKQNAVQGVLYLENSLATHAFTVDHVEILKILTSQIAISLENASLYESVRSVTERLNLALKAANIGTWSWHIPTNKVTWDERMYEIYGVKKENFAHTRENVLSLVHPDDRATLDANIKRVLETEAPFNVEHRIVRSNDKSIHTVIGLADIYRDAQGHPLRLVGVNWDITQRKCLEEERLAALQQTEEKERQRAKEAEEHKERLQEFIDTVCHEVRNPLNGIYGAVTLLSNDLDELDELAAKAKQQFSGKITATLGSILTAAREKLEILDTCAKQEKVIVDDVLDYSKLESKKITLNDIVFNLKTLITSVINIFISQINKKNLKISLELPEAPLFFKADSYRLTQILLNLVSNAMKFTSHGGIKISIQTKPLSATQTELTELFVVVEDTGIGMTEDEQTCLFKRFSQVCQRTASEYGGSGLGLAISKQLIEMMGGKIWVESQKGIGTKFNFTIQCKNASEKEQADLQVESEEQAMMGGEKITPIQKNILIVEDNIVNQRILENFLKRRGYFYQVANNGLEALEKFGECTFGVILMDIEMPKMGGLEATRKIRQQEQIMDLPATPIIGLSGNARQEQMQDALKAGMNAYITKPYLKQELYAAIEKYMAPEKNLASPKILPCEDTKPTSSLTRMFAHKITPPNSTEIQKNITSEEAEETEETDEYYEVHACNMM